MDIVYVANDIYASYLGISMISLFHNNRKVDKITVYVLSNEIMKDNICKFT